MDLREKLDNLKPVMGLLDDGRRAEFPRDTTTENRVLRGKTIDTPHGPCYLVRSSYHQSYRHGRVRLAGLAEMGTLNMSILGRSQDLSGMDPERTVFLDTETTGLAGGAGTYTFLVGLGRFDGGRFVISQYFMQDFSQEAALLWTLERDWGEADYLVTYNGRTYDIPLLCSRFIMQRQPTEVEKLRHLDLLHVVRRLFRRRIGNCSLTNVEEAVLGHYREGDVPGSLIPGVYFDYLRNSDPNPLVPVFEHNAQDILALAAVLARVLELNGDRDGGEHGLDLLSLGTLYQNLGLEDRAAGTLCWAREADVKGAERLELMERLGLSLKRLGRLDEAEEVWLSMVQSMIEPRLHPYEELAKLFEHRKRDYTAAKDWVLKGLKRLEIALTLYGDKNVEEDIASLEYRLARLERKLGKQAGRRRSPVETPAGAG